MNPSDAKVFSSGISGLLCSKKRNEISYSRLGQNDGSIEFSNVHFKKDSTSLCAKLCYGLLGLILLFASLGSALIILNLKHFTMEVRLKRGNVRVYRFDQELVVFVSKEKVTTSKVSAFVTLHVINKTDGECWFGILLTLPKDKNKFLAQTDSAFLASVTSARIDNKARRRFEVYGNSKTSSEFSFYIHNILRQLLPVIKVKLYEFILSKMTSSTTRIEVEKQGYLPGPVHVTRTMMTKNDFVTVMSKADPNDFENFSSKDGESPIASWKLTYQETSVVNGNTGMLKSSDLFLSGHLPLGSDPTLDRRRMSSGNRGLDVTFRSVARLLDENQEKVKQWKDVVKNENDVSHRLNFASSEKTPLVYFAPSKNPDKEPLDDLKELAILTKNSTGRSSKLPPTIQIVASMPGNIESESFNENDEVNDDTIYDNDVSDIDDVDHNDDDDVTYNDVETNDVNEYDERGDDVRDGNGNKVSWSTPNFSPFGLGYEVRRKRSVEINKADKKNKIRNTRYTRFKKETPDFDAIWDELMSSTPRPNTEAPRVVRSSILGLDFRAEINYRVHVDDDDEDDDEHDDYREDDDEVGWRVTTAFRVTVGQYRITPIREVYTLRTIRRTLKSKGKLRSQWTVHAGDFVVCVPLFYIQQLCAAARLTFNVEVTHRMPRVSKSYPTQLIVHIGQTVTNNATLSAHVSTWFHESGFYTKGTVAMAKMPIKLSFREGRTPEWCVTGDLLQKMVRIHTVPLSRWNCSLDNGTLDKTCHEQTAAANNTLAEFDLDYSSAKGTMFDNWHYPVRCQRYEDFRSN